MPLIQHPLERRIFLKSLAAGGTLTLAGLSRAQARQALSAQASLDGLWSVRLDPGDIGIAENWAKIPGKHTFEIPNSLSDLGLGDPVSVNTPWTGLTENADYFTSAAYIKYRTPDDTKVPFCLQPDTYYKGAAWYQRDIEIPQSWSGKRIVLFLERAHWETRIWVNGKPMGSCEALGTPHEYDLGLLKAGKYHLAIRVDNRVIKDIGTNSHAITDHTQGNWNGIVGEISLSATDLTWIEDLQLYPDAVTRTVDVAGQIKTHANRPGTGKVEMTFAGKTQSLAVAWTADGGTFKTTVQYPVDAALWDEFSPGLHVFEAKLGDNDPIRIRFGFRTISATQSHFLINGRPAFMRGTLECCIFPDTGHPPTDKAEWLRIYKVAQSFGLNFIRFHSYCPPKAAFDAADELGIYCQAETCWANASTTLGDGKPVDGWIMDETDRILKAYGNHPSFMFMLYGNEPSGPKDRSPYLSKYVSHYKALDRRRLWSGGAGWPELPENEFHVVPEPRIQRWKEQLNSRVNARPPETKSDYAEFMSKRTVPVMSHEIGEWCAYPDFDEISQYNGYLKAKNFEIFQDRLSDNGLSHLARDFLMASGKLQTLLYKEEIESTLRTSNMAGFQLLALYDFPGQGSALVGVLNAFWKEKGYVNAADFSRFCQATVPLARLEKRVFTSDETLSAQIDISHFGGSVLSDVQTFWRLESNGQILAEGKFAPTEIAIGVVQSVGHIDIDLTTLTQASACKLFVTVNAAELAVPAENDWDIWIYPAPSKLKALKHVHIVNSVGKAIELVNSGKTVILSLPKADIRNFEQDRVEFGFSTIFWNTSWSARQAPTTLGIFCDPKHPALASFPTDTHTNWQWWYLVHRAAPLRMDLMPEGSETIVRVIDDWYTARSLALVTEFKCGKGKLLVCGFDLTGPLSDPVSAQMLYSLTQYAGSSKCAPKVVIEEAALRRLTI